jgi:ATP-dependent helicase/nuclease subunit A
MTAGSRGKPPQAPDQEERARIVSELDRNMLVEAAAGTGKTTSMLARMIALIATGRCEAVRTLAAVTFTRKAAAELRGRFQVALEKEVRAAGPGPERQRLEQALASLEQCFIGTIHSFCGRLLRERPVEAGVDLEFEELDEEEDGRLRKEAWDAYAARARAHDEDGVIAELDRVGLRLSDLEAAFERFADYPDVEDWPVLPAAESGLPAAAKGIEREVRTYVEHMERLAPNLPDETGNDKLIPRYKRLPRVISHYDDLLHLPSLMEVLEMFDGDGRIVQKVWKSEGRFTREDAIAEEERWKDFRLRVAAPALRAWRELRYGPVLRVLREVRDVYDRLRVERGELNFQDLLMKAAGLLRDRPHVRKYFQDRFRFLLVDEFQDTDPIQAEVMFLLTAEDPEQTDWRRCRPRPGSLFVVGDPKQSIYRFRRADIVTYNEVKEIIRQVGGKGVRGAVVRLSANFRTSGELIDWVNRVFAPLPGEAPAPRHTSGRKPERAGSQTCMPPPGHGPGTATGDPGPSAVNTRFPSVSSEESPAYVPLAEGRTDGNRGTLSGLYVIRVPEDCGNKQAVIEYEADRIARTIRHALDSGATVSRTRQQILDGVPERVSPADFLIVTRTRASLSAYARRLEAYGVPHRVTGGSALNEVGELWLLCRCLEAAVHPDDPVALVAALRSPLFGVSDATLYAFRRAGGVFSYRAEVPAGLGGEAAGILEDAFTRLRRYAAWLARLPAVAAVDKIVSDLGLMVLASIGPGGDGRAGGLGKAVELLRAAQQEMWTSAQLVEFLGRLVDREELYDGISARSEERPEVRIMNLHKVKGLEAPVVFLAEPAGEADRPVPLHVDRSGPRILGYTAVTGERRGALAASACLAQPPGWDQLEEKERRFLAAEALRLRYVAATRAGSALVVSQRAKGNKASGWKYFAEHLAIAPELPDPGSAAEPVPGGREPRRLPEAEAREALDAIPIRLGHAAQPSLRVVGAKEFALRGPGQGGEAGPGDVSGLFRAEPAEGPQPDDPERPGAARAGLGPPPAGEHGVEWGTVIHRLLEVSLTEPQADLRALARDLLAEQALDPGLAETAARTVGQVASSSVWQRALASERRLAEVPFEIFLEGEGPAGTLVRGQIDLVFKEEGGWVLVDYKTDRTEEAGAAALARRYAPQVELYARCWQRSTEEPVKEALLYFLSADRVVRIPGSAGVDPNPLAG